ncbi:MAG TPA: hypothetical protein VFG10_02755 [Saprospiraceae bacterium]|nr:hypothetical protein [Saprospiraceae bacterium]
MYNFNEKEKRLEPSETLCQYCETEHSTSMEDNYFVDLYMEKNRTNVIVYRSVKYSKIPVGVPRCKTCMNVHSNANLMGGLLGWGIALLVVILWFSIFGVSGFIGVLLFPFMGWGLMVWIEKSMIRKKQIYTKMEGAKQNEAVQDLVLSGWSFTMPMA